MTRDESLIWSALAERFLGHGWTEQALHARPNNRQWALQRPNGLVATTSVFVAVLRDQGQVAMSPGVSHQAVAELRAALTLSARDGELLREGPRLVRPTPLGQSELGHMVDEATVVAVSIADAFEDAAELLERLGAKAREGNERALQSAFLLAGALRDAHAVEQHLAAFEAPLAAQLPNAQTDFLGRLGSAGQARFVRQARRWLDAGMPDLPPVTEHRARQAQRSSFPQVMLASLRRADARHDAELRLSKQVRRNRSLTTADLRRLLSDDLAARGLPHPPTTVALVVDRVVRDQTLAGLVRTQLDGALHVAELAGRIRTAVREMKLPTTPADAALPENAVFGYRPDRNAHAEVRLAPEAIPRLRSLADRNEVRVRRSNYLPVWLDGSRVMVGATPVGVLAPESSAAFGPIIAAAAAMDEHVRAHASFVDLAEPVLSFPLPAHEGAPSAYR